MKYKGYIIAESKPTGGKAGKGHNKSATIQVRECTNGGFFLYKQFRYVFSDLQSKNGAIIKAMSFVDTCTQPRKESTL